MTLKLQQIFFGGSFDPIHNGHLHIARLAENLSDRVVFIPCKQNPLSEFSPKASNHDRNEMLKLVLNNSQKWMISTIELDSNDEKSFTIDTISKLNKSKKKSGFIIGSDTVMTLPNWKNCQELLTKLHFLIFKRPGVNEESLSEFLSSNFMKEAEYTVLEEKCLNISSTQVKIYASMNESLSDFVPEQVENYIKTNNLYKVEEKLNVQREFSKE